MSNIEAPKTERYRKMVERVHTALIEQIMAEFPVKEYSGRAKEYFDNESRKEAFKAYRATLDELRYLIHQEFDCLQHIDIMRPSAKPSDS